MQLTRVSREQLLAAGRALSLVAPGDVVAEIDVNGRQLNPEQQQAARAAYESAQAADVARVDADRPLPGNVGAKMHRAVHKLETNFDKIEAKLDSNKVGRVFNRIINADPEHVATKFDVHVRLTDGRKLPTARLEVLNRKASANLEKVSMVSEVIEEVPFVGFIPPGITAVLCGLGAALTGLLGRKAVAKALVKTAAKHSALCGLEVVDSITNFLSAVVSGAAAVIDLRDVTKLATAPTVADLTNLGSPPARR